MDNFKCHDCLPQEFWLQCDDCDEWREVSKEEHHTYSKASASWTCGSRFLCTPRRRSKRARLSSAASSALVAAAATAVAAAAAAAVAATPTANTAAKAKSFKKRATRVADNPTTMKTAAAIRSIAKGAAKKKKKTNKKKKKSKASSGGGAVVAPAAKGAPKCGTEPKVSTGAEPEPSVRCLCRASLCVRGVFASIVRLTSLLFLHRC